jgi:hypothetical protein
MAAAAADAAERLEFGLEGTPPASEAALPGTPLPGPLARD